ncbi:MAG: histidine kinase N-terminal 7TM domain-containing protein, partial [Phototrophicaceae bacterium]
SITSGLTTLWLAELGWRRRRVRGATAFSIMMVLGCAWALLYAAELAANQLSVIETFARLKYAVIAWAGPAWFVFAAQFVGQGRWLRPRIMALPLIIAAVSSFSAVTNLDNLFFAQLTLVEEFNLPVLEITPGPWMAIMLAQAYLLLVVGTGMLLWWAVRSLRAQRYQALPLMLIVLVPLTASFLSLANLTNIDLAAITFSAVSVVAGFGLLRLRVFDLLPVAYDTVVYNMPDGVLVVDMDNRILFLNPALESITGLDIQLVFGERIKDVLPPLRPYCERFAETPRLETEIDLFGHTFELRVSPLMDRTNRAQGRLVIFHDVTERQQIEEERRRTEARYRALFDRASDAIFLLGTPGDHIIDANPAASALLGYPREELMSMCLADVQVSDERTDRTGTQPRFEIAARRSDGAVLDIELTVALLNEGDTSLLLTIARDVTERKAAEAQLNQRIEQLQVVRQVSDEIGDTLNVDHVLLISLDAALRLSGAQGGFIALINREKILALKAIGAYPTAHSKDASSAVAPDDIDLDAGLIGEVMRSRQPLRLKSLPPTGDYVSATNPRLPNTRAQIVVPLIARDNVIGLLNLETHDPARFSDEVFELIKILADRIAMAMDNARLFRQAQMQIGELQSLYEQVSYLEGIKTDMIRIAAHDLRNPLAVMLGYLQIFDLDRDQLSAEHQEYTDLMLKSVRRMNKMIDDILSLERIERMANQESNEVFDLIEQVTKAVDEFGQQAARKGLALTYDPGKLASVSVTGDAPQIYEAITNLISNAIKYTPEGGSIHIVMKQDSVRQITYCVKDTGYGIPPDQQQRLFQPFYRVKNEETRKVDGTGLGLHLVKNIVERHGGQIVFESDYGKGSTFGFSLPVYAEETASVE